MKYARQTAKCSFCGKSQPDTGALVAGPGVNICAQCVAVCNAVLSRSGDRADAASRLADLTVPKPREIKAFLDRYVIGQDYPKKVLSVAVHNHYKRLRQNVRFAAEDPLARVEIEKSNILLVGPTGSGKTLLARTLARCLNVPFSISDATTLTEAGYVGEDVENILLRLIQAADHDVPRAETGIIYVDEIDKIGRRTENVSITRDVSGEGVQQALLKIIEGTIANVPVHGGRKHPQQEHIRINTEHILFICGGAFVGLDDIVKRRVGRQVLGFQGREEGKAAKPAGADPLALVEPEDLLRYGLIPEFIGRLPVVASLAPLNADDLVRILTEPENCMVNQYRKLLAMDGAELRFSNGALRALAEVALRKGTGARGLRAILEQVMLDLMYEVPGRNASQRPFRVTKRAIDAWTRSPEDGNRVLRIA